jgi:hypothetical protein
MSICCTKIVQENNCGLKTTAYAPSFRMLEFSLQRFCARNVPRGPHRAS